MTSSDRTVVVLFALAVVAALGAVAWLVLGPAPPAVTPVAVGPGKTVATTPRRPDPVKGPLPKGTTPDRPKVKPPLPVFEVKGVVHGPDDAPVADAEVVVFTGGSRESLQAPAAAPAAVEKVPAEVLRELFAMEPEEAAAVGLYSGVPALPSTPAAETVVDRAKTGADGTFRIPVKARGPFRVEARKEGVGHAVAADAFAGGPDLLLRLGPAATLSGRVVTTAGAPVEGAVLVIRSGGTARGATSGADGSFAVPDLAPGKYAVEAGAQGFAPTVLPLVEAPSASPLEVVLGAGYAARITVSKWELPPPPAPGSPPRRGSPVLPGAPLEGVLVVLLHRQTRTYRSGVTGPDGIARIERLGAGRWSLSARREGFNVGLGKEIHFRTGSPPEESREVKMFVAVPTPVRVMDEAGAPVRNARVYTGGLDVEFDERHSVLVGKTDDEGRIQFSFDDGIPWKGVLWVVPEDGGAVVMVEPEDPTSGEEVRAVVRPGRVIQGTVTDQKGKGIKGAQVKVDVTDDERDIEVGLFVYTDEKGAYRFPPLPWGDVSFDVEAGDEYDTEDVDADNRDNPLVRDFKLEVGGE